MSVELRVKVRSFAAEAAIIKNEEARFRRRMRRAKTRQKPIEGAEAQLASLHEHRMNVVRKAARTAHLAAGFIRGMPYRRIELTAHEAPSRPDILRLLERYGTPEFRNSPKANREKALITWLDTPADQPAVQAEAAE